MVFPSNVAHMGCRTDHGGEAPACNAPNIPGISMQQFPMTGGLCSHPLV